MTLVLTEEEAASLLNMADVLALVEEAFHALGLGEAGNIPRRRVRTGKALLHAMSASFPPAETLGLKAYVSAGWQPAMVVLVWDAQRGSLQAMIGASRLGAMRTGAASGIATRYLAVENASTLGVIGTGYQARTQVEAICAVRPIHTVRAFGRDAEKRRAFCQDMARLTGVEVVPADSAEEAVRGAQVVVTITNAAQPVLLGEWLEPGIHINAAGSNMATRPELDVAAVRRADRIFADQVDTARIESGDLIAAVEAGALSWDDVGEFGEVVAGKRTGRENPRQITLFESQGIAVEDVAVASWLVKRAREQGVGRELDLV